MTVGGAEEGVMAAVVTVGVVKVEEGMEEVGTVAAKAAEETVAVVMEAAGKVAGKVEAVMGVEVMVAEEKVEEVMVAAATVAAATVAAEMAVEVMVEVARVVVATVAVGGRRRWRVEWREDANFPQIEASHCLGVQRSHNHQRGPSALKCKRPC